MIGGGLNTFTRGRPPTGGIGLPITRWSKGAAPAADISYVTETHVDGLSSTSARTFTGVAIGDAHANRVVVALVRVVEAAASIGSLSSVTIGGVTATVLASRTTGNTSALYIVAAAVPTGTTADIVVTHGRHNSVSVATFRWVRKSGSATAAYDADEASLGGPVSIDVPQGGAVLALYGNVNSTQVTWTAPMVELFEFDLRSDEWTSVAMATGLPSGSVSVGNTGGGSGASSGLVCASFAP